MIQDGATIIEAEGSRLAKLRPSEPTAVGLGLVAADSVLIALHIVQWISPFADRGFFLGDDRGMGEAFQYAKFLVLIAILYVVYRWRRAPIYASLILLFGYLTVDDALLFHEQAGEWLAYRLGIPWAFGLRDVDFGELLYISLAGAFLLGQFGLSYLASPAEERVHGRGFFALLLLLGVCGVGFDALHSFGNASGFGPLLEILEDGGEMIAVSLMVAHATSLLPPDWNPLRTFRKADAALGISEA